MGKYWENPATTAAPPAEARVPDVVRIGTMEIRPATVLAPMAGVTDTVFRRFIREMGQPVPDVLRITAEFVLNRDLKKTFDTEPVDFVRIAMLLEMVKREGVRVDQAAVGYSASNSLTRLLQQLEQNPLDRETLERTYVLATLFATTQLPVDYWHAQNTYYSILNKDFASLVHKSGPDSLAWQQRFLALGERLQISVPQIKEAALPIAG